MTLVKIGGETYPATIIGNVADKAWDGRETKTINTEMTYAQAAELFTDGCEWSILYVPDTDPTATPEEYDNSDYCFAGDLTDHRDGTISAKMGKMTALEEVLELMLGGEEE